MRLPYVESQIELKYYSIAYFKRITEFDTPYRLASTNGGAHMELHNWELRYMLS